MNILKHILAAAAIVVLGAGCDIGGSGRDGSITPVFASPVSYPFGLSSVGGNPHPAFVDIDNDGDLDAFIGDGDGDTFFFRNTGSASSPAFAAPIVNPFGLADVGNYSYTAFVDIDCDGDPDAFIGNSAGDTFYFENTAD